MIKDELIPVDKKLFDVYPMAVHPDDISPYAEIKGHWICFSAFDLYGHPLITDEELLMVMTEEYNKEVAEEFIIVAKRYWND